MSKGWVSGAGRRHRWVARVLVFALALPLLLGLLPQPGLSAAAALDRDLAWSLCAHGGGSPADSQDHQQKHESQCILCISGCPLCAPALAAGQSVLAAAPLTSEVLPPVSDSRLRVVQRVRLDGTPTRGPPLA